MCRQLLSVTVLVTNFTSFSDSILFFCYLRTRCRQRAFVQILGLLKSISYALFCNFSHFFALVKITTLLFSCDCVLFDKEQGWGRGAHPPTGGIHRYKSFKIKSFADPHLLILIESYRYKIMGGGLHLYADSKTPSVQPSPEDRFTPFWQN